MRHLLVVGVLLAFVAKADLVQGPGDSVEFLEFKAQNQKNNSKWGPVLKDVMNHEAPGDSNNYDDMITLAHETSHGIHAHIRNKMNNTGKRANGFYVLENRAVIVEEPKIRKRDIAAYVPASLRGDRYQLYIVGQTEWDDTPLYIYDEWNAYVNGGTAGVDLVQKGLWSYGWRDGVAGQLEFAVYAIALANAVKDKDANYYNNYKQFKEFTAFNIRRSMDGFKIGSQMKDFKWDKQDKYYESLKTGADAAKLRDFARGMFGDSWCQEVLGF